MSVNTFESGQFPPTTVHLLNQAPWMWEAEYDPGTMAEQDLVAIAQHDSQLLWSLSAEDLVTALLQRQNELLTTGTRLTDERVARRQAGEDITLDVTESYDYQMQSDRLNRAHAEMLSRNPKFKIKPLR